MNGLHAKIDALHKFRLEVADHDRELKIRELDARKLRAQLETEHTTTNKSEGEKRAKVDQRYVDFELVTAMIAHKRDELLAQAEALRLEVLATIHANEIAGMV